MKNLKLISFWLMLVMGLTATVFTACDKKDGEPDNSGTKPENAIVGTWKSSQILLTLQGQKPLDFTAQIPQEDGTFAADGGYNSTTYGTGTYSTNGADLSIAATQNGVTQTIGADQTIMILTYQAHILSCTYSVDGNTLTQTMQVEVTAYGVTIPAVFAVIYTKQ
jgi:hypothetical protein